MLENIFFDMIYNYTPEDFEWALYLYRYQMNLPDEYYTVIDALLAFADD